MYYLMVKTHNITQLKYLCKCTDRDPYTYKGSGVYWKRHLKEHGYSITTEVIFETENIDEFNRVCLEYSEKYNVKDSKEWANLIIETGLDGGTTHNDPYWLKGFKHSPESRKRISEASKQRAIGRKVTNETKEKISKKLKGQNAFWLKRIEKTEEHKKKLSESQLGISKSYTEDQIKNLKTSMKSLSKTMYKCSVCGKIGNAGQIGRYHKECMKELSWNKIKLNEHQ